MTVCNVINCIINKYTVTVNQKNMKIEIKYKSNTYLIIVTCNIARTGNYCIAKTRICKIGTSDNNISTQIGSICMTLKINSPYTHTVDR